MKRAARAALSAGLGRERTDLVLTQAIERNERLRYRLSPEARASVRRLAELRDRFAGERCFVLGNGPSLSKLDLEPLRNEHTFGLNRVYLLFEKLGLSTNFLVCVNRLVIEQTLDELLAANAEDTFLSWGSRDLVPVGSDVTYVRSSLIPSFSTNPISGVWEGATVTYVALQLAYWMGFSTAILIGVDHRFTTAGPAHEVVSLTGDDPNHFDPAYFGPGFRWQLPDLVASEEAYRRARTAFESAGRKVLDATVGGNLQVFDKVDYESLVTRPRLEGAV